MARFVTTQATGSERLPFSPLIFVRIVTGSAGHFRFREALAHRQPCQLVAGVNPANALALQRISADAVKLSQLVTWAKLKRHADQTECAGVALSTNIKLSLARKIRWLHDVAGRLYRRGWRDGTRHALAQDHDNVHKKSPRPPSLGLVQVGRPRLFDVRDVTLQALRADAT